MEASSSVDHTSGVLPEHDPFGRSTNNNTSSSTNTPNRIKPPQYPSEIKMDNDLGYAESVISEDYASGSWGGYQSTSRQFSGSVASGGPGGRNTSHDGGESVSSVDAASTYGYSLDGASLATPMAPDITRLDSADSSNKRGSAAGSMSGGVGASYYSVDHEDDDGDDDDDDANKNHEGEEGGDGDPNAIENQNNDSNNNNNVYQNDLAANDSVDDEYGQEYGQEAEYAQKDDGRQQDEDENDRGNDQYDQYDDDDAEDENRGHNNNNVEGEEGVEAYADDGSAFDSRAVPTTKNMILHHASGSPPPRQSNEQQQQRQQKQTNEDSDDFGVGADYAELGENDDSEVGNHNTARTTRTEDYDDDDNEDDDASSVYKN
ncbi:hypothetical protein ACA910_022323 [Epithemia clementina (nom. ined.)]